MILSETYTLKDSLTIPKFGLGTWLIDDKSTAEAVRKAIGLGYRLIDTAQAYGNERGVGDKIEYHQVSSASSKANPARIHPGDPEVLMPANTPKDDAQEAHAADDVLLNAGGPGSEYFHGTMDNTEVFFGILRALGINGNKK